MDEKMFWIKMLNDIREDTQRLPKVGFAELMAEYFYLPKTIKLNSSTFKRLIWKKQKIVIAIIRQKIL